MTWAQIIVLVIIALVIVFIASPTFRGLVINWFKSQAKKW
jgi:hypothetical protein